MGIEILNQFRDILLKNKKSVSELEYTKNNYDNKGKLIEEDLPTITTDFCEVGLHDDEIYFVVIVEPKTFNLELFNKIKDKEDVQIYGFTDFNRTLYPSDKFDFDKFLKQNRKEKYIQIQFNYKNISASDLFEEYSSLATTFKGYSVVVINQLETILTKDA